MEKYIPIKDFSNYEVSDFGNVRNIKTGRVLKPGTKSNGYKVVVLSNDGVKNTKLVHRLVADAFCNRDRDDLVVNHRDGNKSNNSANNLEWCTSGENNKHAYDTELKIPSKAYNQPSNRKVRIVETGEVFDSVKECARCIGANSRHISDCLNGKLKKHHGFHYEDVY